MSINNTLKRHREKAGLTQAQLAKKVGIVETHYQKLEYGSSEPRITLTRKLAKALGVTEAELFPLPDDAAGD